MTFRPGLRLKVAAVFAAACITVVGALGVVLFTASERMEHALVTQIVTEELDALIARHRQNPALPQPTGPNLEYYIAHGPEELARVPEALRTLPEGYHEIGRALNERHVGVRRADGTTFIVSYDAGPHEQREVEFQELVYASFGVVVLVALGLGYWLAGLLTRQVTGLAATVKSLAPDAARPPLAQAGQDPEVALLAAALDDYRARIARMIQREQEFTGNASHELRTPLTAIRTTCELLLADSSLPDKARQRVEMIEAAAERMSEQIQVLLFLAREQALGTSETVSVAEAVTDAAEPYRAELTRKGLQFRMEVEPAATVQLNRQALEIVLTNLIRNAVQHTERGFVAVSYAAGRLMVSDSGAGIAAGDVRRLFERFYRAASKREGVGLGLAIVKRVCDLYGWTIEVDSAPGHGSAFSISLR